MRRNEEAIAAARARIEGSCNYRSSWYTSVLDYLSLDNYNRLVFPLISEMIERVQRYEAERMQWEWSHGLISVTYDVLRQYTAHNPQQYAISIMSATPSTFQKIPIFGMPDYHAELSKHEAMHLYLVAKSLFGIHQSILPGTCYFHKWLTSAALLVTTDGEIKIFQSPDTQYTLEHILTWDYLQAPGISNIGVI